MRAIELSAALTFVLAGCAAPYTWENPALEGQAAERQREIDVAECNVIAMRAAPMPQIPAMPAPAAPQSYSVSGTTTVYDTNGNAYTGQYNGTARPMATFDPSADLAAGANYVGGILNNQQSARDRESFAEACMLRRGWAKVPVGAQASVAPVAADAAQSPQTSISTPPPETNFGGAPAPEVPPARPARRYDEWQKNDSAGTTQ